MNPSSITDVLGERLVDASEAAHCLNLPMYLRATEIAPEYVDVAVKRFQQNFPDVPVTLMATGQTFAAVANERLGGGA